MSEATERISKRKRINLSGSAGDYVDIPVIYSAVFKTLAEQAQERILYFDNSSKSSRKTHIKRVFSSVGTTYLDVERIDELYVKDVVSQGQELTYIVKNNDPPPIQLDGRNIPAHEKVHYVRYFKDNDNGSDSWVDVELIDQLKIIDPSSQYQDWIYYAKHPSLGNAVSDATVPYELTEGNCDPSLPLVGEDAGIDPPYRLDLFQNIINFGSSASSSAVYFIWVYIGGLQHERDTRVSIDGTGRAPWSYPEAPGSLFYGEGGVTPDAFATMQPDAGFFTFVAEPGDITDETPTYIVLPNDDPLVDYFTSTYGTGPFPHV